MISELNNIIEKIDNLGVSYELFRDFRSIIHQLRESKNLREIMTMTILEKIGKYDIESKYELINKLRKKNNATP